MPPCISKDREFLVAAAGIAPDADELMATEQRIQLPWLLSTELARYRLTDAFSSIPCILLRGCVAR